MQEVVGSTPISSTIQNPIFIAVQDVIPFLTIMSFYVKINSKLNNDNTP